MEYTRDEDLLHRPGCPPECEGCRLIEARRELSAIDFEMWRRERLPGD